MINFARANAELRRAFNLLSYQFIIKGCNSGIARWDRFTEQGMGGWDGVELLWPSEHITLPKSPYFTNPEDLWTLSFWVFTEASSHRHYWLNHRPLVIDSTSSPSPLPGDRGMGLKVPALMCLVPWATSPIPRCFPKEPHSHKPRCHGKGFVMNIKTLLLLLPLRKWQEF